MSKGFPTLVTHITFLARMDSFMVDKLAEMDKGFSTLLTQKWFHSSVDFFIHLKISVSLDGFFKLMICTFTVNSLTILMRSETPMGFIRWFLLINHLSRTSWYAEWLRRSDICMTLLIRKSYELKPLILKWLLSSFIRETRMRRGAAADAAFVHGSCGRLVPNPVVGFSTLTVIFILTVPPNHLSSAKNEKTITNSL